MKLKNYIALVLLLFLSNSILSQVKKNEVISKDKNGLAKMINFKETKISADKNSVISFLKEQYKTDLNMEFKSSERKGKERKGFLSQKYNQYYKGLKVEFSRVNAVSKNGLLHFVNGSFINVKKLSVNPAITESTAIELAKKYIGAEKYMWENLNNERFIKELKGDFSATYFPKGELVIIREQPSDETSKAVLAYKVKICAEIPLSKDNVYVNAKTGEIIYKNTLINHVQGEAETRYSGMRTIETEQIGNQYRLRDYSRGNGIETFNLNNSVNYSNVTDFIDNDNNWTSLEYDNENRDNAALDLHWGVEMTFDYFFQQHDYSSFDGEGMRIKAYANWRLLNAQWDSSERVIRFGRGNPGGWNAFPSLDVVAHEFAHGIDEFSSNLVYQNESGALDEGIADIWGAMVELFAAPEKETYQIGEEITVNEALRSLSDPKLFNNPDTYHGLNWHYGSGDSGGVHTNSTVMGHWFYLLAEGSSATDEINDNYDTFSFSGIGTEKASEILFYAQQNYFTNPFMNYNQASILIKQATKDLYGLNSNELFQVEYAWFAVGIGRNPTEVTPSYIQGPTQLTPGLSAYYNLESEYNVYATEYVWSIPSGCYNYCWSIQNGQGTNQLSVRAGSIGMHDITCEIYDGDTMLERVRITVNVQNPYVGGGDSDPCGNLEIVGSIIFPPDPCDTNNLISDKGVFKNVKVYDFTGKKIIDISNVESFDMGNLSSGFYILKMKLNNNIITKKILK